MAAHMSQAKRAYDCGRNSVYRVQSGSVFPPGRSGCGEWSGLISVALCDSG